MAIPDGGFPLVLEALAAGVRSGLRILQGWRFDEFGKDFTIIAPDLRGLGDSSRPATGYDKKTLAVDIHELVKSLGLAQQEIDRLLRKQPESFEIQYCKIEGMRADFLAIDRLSQRLIDAATGQLPALLSNIGGFNANQR